MILPDSKTSMRRFIFSVALLFVFQVSHSFASPAACLRNIADKFFFADLVVEAKELSLVSKLTAQLSVIEIWQVLAWVSLAISLVWGIWRSKKGLSAEPYLLPWTCHLSWIMLSFFWNAVGAMVPFVMVAYVI